MGQFGEGERGRWGGARVEDNFPFFFLCHLQRPVLYLVSLTFPFLVFSLHLFISYGQHNAGQIAGTIITEHEEDLNRMFDKNLEKQKDDEGFQCQNVYSHTIAYRLHASLEI